MEGDIRHMGSLINPRPKRGQYQAGFSNTGGSPKPRKRAPCQKKKKKQPMKQIDKEQKTKQKHPKIINMSILAEKAKSIIDKVIRKELKRKWNYVLHYKDTKLFYSDQTKTEPHLTKLISIITGFNCLSYIQLKTYPTINSLRRRK